MKEVPFPVARARRRKPSPPRAEPWRKPDPFHVPVEERRRTVLRGRPVLFWGAGPGPGTH